METSQETAVPVGDRRRILWGRTLAGTAVVTSIVSIAYLVALREWDSLAVGIAHNGLWAIGIGSVAWVMISTQPRNKLTWALAWAAFFAALTTGSFAAFRLVSPASVLELSLDEIITLSPSDLPVASAIALSPLIWAWIPGFLLVLTLGLLWFPNGEPPSRRWRWVAWSSITAIALGSVGAALAFLPSSTVPYDSPVGGAFALGIGGLALISMIASISALVVRHRRSSGVTRHQIRWIAWSGTFGAATFIFLLFDQESTAMELNPVFANSLLAVAEVLFILSFAVAITKYRLYDIDLVISKTVVFGSLAVIIASVYVVIVVGVGQLLGQTGEASFGLSVAATAVVAIAFQPVRRRVQRWANRLVYGDRATPYEVLASFSHRAAEVRDAQLIERIPRLIVDGTSASAATLWVLEGERFVASGTWPLEDEQRVLALTDDVFSDPQADDSLPIVHDGELLGGISLIRARGETITPVEVELLENLASGMGLSLRNARLTQRLKEQVASLEASRERILAAADEARQELELDLDTGPQQQLVALKVKLGPTRVMAEKAGAARTSGVLAQLEHDAGEALRAVRDFATGVYPPLLRAEGLGPAITQRVRNAPIPVSVDAGTVGRHPAELEAAVYFCVLEALQNVVKYAQAESVQVTLTEVAGTLAFDVVDDGLGFDIEAVEAGAGLANMADRLDAISGRLVVESSPGGGTTVSGSIPIRQLATTGA